MASQASGGSKDEKELGRSRNSSPTMYARTLHYQSSAREIATSSCLSVIPMTILTITLVLLVLKFQVHTRSGADFLSAATPTQLRGDAFYIDVNSTLLVFIASWMSSLAPLLTGFLINLASFPISQKLLEDTIHRPHALPTLAQLTIIIKFCSGAPCSGLWDLLVRYRCRILKHETSRMLKSLALVMKTAMLASILIFAADTWLHIGTSTIWTTQENLLATHDAEYSLLPLPGCLLSNNSLAGLNQYNASCTLLPNHNVGTLSNVTLTAQTLVGQSSSISVSQHTETQSYSYLSVASASTDPTHDFTATTFAVHTECSPISRACNLTSNYTTTFNCGGGAFSSDIASLDEVGLIMYPYQTSDISNILDASYGVNNPFYYAAATLGFASSNLDTPIFQDEEISSKSNQVAAVFFCKITVFDVEYDLIDGKIRRFSTMPSSDGIANMFNTAVAITSFGRSKMNVDMGVAATIATSAQDWADRFAVTLSNTLLSGAAGSVQRGPALAAQQRSPILVTKLPMVPFYFQIASNIVFVLMGFVLTIFAACSTKEARRAQEHLTVAGAVEDLFDAEKSEQSVVITEEHVGKFLPGEEKLKIGMAITQDGIANFKTFSILDNNSSANATSAANEDAASIDQAEYQSTEQASSSRFPSLLPRGSENVGRWISEGIDWEARRFSWAR